MSSWMRTIALGILALVASIWPPERAEAYSPLPDPCGSAPISYAHEGRWIGLDKWQMEMSIEHHRGLVFRNITVGGEFFLDSFHLGYLEVIFEGVDAPQIVRFCSGDDRTDPVDWSPDTGTLIWSFYHRIDQTDLHGELRVTYRTRIKTRPEACAGRDNSSAFTRSCIRFVPTIEYEWLPDPTQPGAYHIAVAKAHIRVGYGHVGVGLVSDGDWAVTAPLSTGLVPILERETSFNAVRRGRSGEWDNIHTALPVEGRRTIVVPGCRAYGYDCTHLHWRWGGSWAPPLDPLAEPYTGQRIPGAVEGTAYLLGDQNLDIAVVADNGEGDVRDPLSLADGEGIAIANRCHLDQNDPFADKVVLSRVVRPVVLWYVATSYQPFDTFFRPGFFALEPLRAYEDQRSIVGWAIDQFFEFNRVRCDPAFLFKGARVTRRAVP